LPAADLAPAEKMSFPPDIGSEIGANALLIRSAAVPWKDQEAAVRGDDVANAEQRIIHGYIGMQPALPRSTLGGLRLTNEAETGRVPVMGLDRPEAGCSAKANVAYRNHPWT
jgi:hypothetical protein